ncbi:hypothetical protein Pmani_034530, partial [Petrolisthes manimaculis]
VVYKATAEDEDLGLTCPLGPGLNTRCPCATITYSLRGDVDKAFTIHESSGQLSLRDGVRLRPARHYQLQIIASNSNVSELGVSVRSLSATQTLTILVHSDDKLQDLLHQNSEAMPVKTEDPVDYEIYQERLKEEEEEYRLAERDTEEDNPVLMFEPQALQRRKRDAAGDTDEVGSTKLEFTRLTTLPGAPLTPGDSLDYELKIILPKLDTAMDLIVEVFVMDPVSGITPMALCNLDVSDIGAMITDETDTALDIAQVRADIERVTNTQFNSFPDRIKINFGKVKNSDTYTAGSTTYGPSTITVTFSALVIINPSYTNTTVMVTAGAEYSDQEYISVSTDSIDADLTAGTYASTLNIPTASFTSKQYEAVTFEVDAEVKHPFADLLFEVSSGDAFLDQFSVTQVGIVTAGLGNKWTCTNSDYFSIKYYKSVSGITNHRAVFSMKLMMMNGQDTTGGYAMKFFVTIYVNDAIVGDVLNVQIGMVVGTDEVAAPSDVTITVDAGGVLATSGVSPTLDTEVAMTLTEVEAPGAVTWALPFNIPSGDTAEIECTIEAGSGDKICGVVYGKVGANIAFLPDLSTAVAYADNKATVKMIISSTGSLTGTDVDKLNLEVTVQYSGVPTVASVTCTGGGSATLTATAGSKGTTDLSGTATVLPVANDGWYEGSQAGLTVTLNFPDGGAPYDSVMVEGAGDLDLTTWGARLCKAWVESAGKAVPCIAGTISTINDGVIPAKAKTASIFDDGFTMNMGPACGTDRTPNGLPEDYEVVVKMVFDIPKTQAFTAESFNMSVGISMGATQDKIFTGWDSAGTSTAAPVYSDVAPILAIRMRPTTILDPEVPTLIQVVMKTPPGSVGDFSLTALVDDVNNIAICRILILHIGSSFPCIDPELYDKESDPYHPNTVTHDSIDPAVSATLELGPLRNTGSGSMYDGKVADEDSILVGVLLKGVALGGSGILTVSLAAPGLATITETETLSISSTPMDGTVPLPAVLPSGTDGNAYAHEGVMKLVDIPLKIPVDYKEVVTVTVSSTAITDIKICMIGVFTVGKNIPCLLPHMAISTDTSVEGAKTEWQVEIPGICYYSVSNNTADNTILVRVGATLLKDGGPSADLSIVVTESTVDMPAVVFSLTKVAGPFTPPPFAVQDIVVVPNDTTVTTVAPGDRVNVAIRIKLPIDAVVPLEVGVMTPSEDGRAFATVHGFQLEGGSNLGCLLESLEYTSELTQNSSLATPLVHISQTDTMLVDLGVITNHGLSYIQKKNTTEDDEVVFTAEILIADHPTAIDGYLIDVKFAIKVGAEAIIVFPKNLIMDRTGTLEIKLLTELIVTNLEPTPFTQGDQVLLTLRVSHTNESSLEANDPKIRLLMPKYMGYTATDTYTPNITGTPTYNKYLDITMDYLFFTDILEAKLTLTVDPDSKIPNGLGVVNATTLLRIVCTTNVEPAFKYCSSTSYVVYNVDGGDCLDNLQLDTLDDCRFTASSAIDSTAAPHEVKSTGWMPAVRSSSTIKHYLTVDLGSSARVVQLSFTAVAGTLSVKTFKIQFSHNGLIFKDACANIIDVDGTGVVSLPGECRFQARFVRLVIVSASDGLGAAAVTDLSSQKIGVKFSNWKGCVINSNPVLEACVTFLTTPLSNDVKSYRHAAFDTSNNFVYFCDISGKKDGAMVCFCSSDGLTWNALPSYVKYLVGYDAATGRMYAMDRKDRAMIASSDCVNWSIVADSLKAGLVASATPPVNIPGKPSGELTPVAIGGGWTADFNGMSLGGTVHAKWADCCT